MGKTKNLFKKIKNTRNGMDLTEAEDIKVARIHRRTIQKKLNDPDNHNGVIIQLEPDILECEVKWALRSITTNTPGCLALGE